MGPGVPHQGDRSGSPSACAARRGGDGVAPTATAHALRPARALPLLDRQRQLRPAPGADGRVLHRPGARGPGVPGAGDGLRHHLRPQHRRRRAAHRRGARHLPLGGGDHAVPRGRPAPARARVEPERGGPPRPPAVAALGLRARRLPPHAGAAPCAGPSPVPHGAAHHGLARRAHDAPLRRLGGAQRRPPGGAERARLPPCRRRRALLSGQARPAPRDGASPRRPHRAHGRIRRPRGARHRHHLDRGPCLLHDGGGVPGRRVRGVRRARRRARLHAQAGPCPGGARRRSLPRRRRPGGRALERGRGRAPRPGRRGRRRAARRDRGRGRPGRPAARRERPAGRLRSPGQSEVPEAAWRRSPRRGPCSSRTWPRPTTMRARARACGRWRRPSSGSRPGASRGRWSSPTRSTRPTAWPGPCAAWPGTRTARSRWSPRARPRATGRVCSCSSPSGRCPFPPTRPWSCGSRRRSSCSPGSSPSTRTSSTWPRRGRWGSSDCSRRVSSACPSWARTTPSSGPMRCT